MKILLLEDELMLQSSILEYLESFGYLCISSSNGFEALDLINSEEFDLYIFDINVPNINGLELSKIIKDKKIKNNIIFISADCDIETIEKAFQLGAKDYLKKPFHLKELAIRIEKIIEHNKKDTSIKLSSNYTFDKTKKSLFYKGKLEILTKKHIDIIDCLSSNIGHIMSLDMLREYVWNNDIVTDATIRTEISRLRKKLKDDFIQNYKGVGYQIKNYEC